MKKFFCLGLAIVLLACGSDDTVDDHGKKNDEGIDVDAGGMDAGDADVSSEATDDITGDDTDTAEVLEIVGHYVTDWDAEVAVTETQWRETSEFGTVSYAISFFENERDYLVAQNSPDDAFNPEKWSRFEWTYDDDNKLYYCQILFSEETFEDADVDANIADGADLEEGCNGFPWTTLLPFEFEDVVDADAGADSGLL